MSLSAEVMDNVAPVQVTEPEQRETVIKVRDLCVSFSGKAILEHLDLDVYRGEILGFVGASGTGKSVLTRTIIGLNHKDAGTIEVLGRDFSKVSAQARNEIERSWGVLFQHGALFSSLTVLQNIQVPMREHLKISQRLMDELAMLKIELVGLKRDAASKFPSELSGGMIKRAALARALALDPEIVFLDEPTSGLDPVGGQRFDQLILELRETLGITVFQVTHDLDSLKIGCDRIAVLADRRVLATGTFEGMREFDHPWIQSYFNGERARRGADTTGMEPGT